MTNRETTNGKEWCEEMIKESVHVLCCYALLFSSVVSCIQAKESAISQTIWNPVLHLTIEYDPSKAKYENFPGVFKAMCAKTLAGESDIAVFARIRSGESEYFANMGVWNSKEVEDVNEGDLIRIQGNKCMMFDIGGALMALPPTNGYKATTSRDTLPWFDSPNECVNGICHLVFRSSSEELLMRRFVKDAIQHAIKAYGSDALFRAQACKPEEEKELSDSGYVIVLQELKTYCSKVPQ